MGTGKRNRRRECTKGGKTRTRADGVVKENGSVRDTPSPPQQTTTNGAELREGGGQTTAPADIEGNKGDEPGYTPTPEDLRLLEVYGDWVHAKPGTHLNGDIGDNAAWQAWWHDREVTPSRRYDAPSRKVRRRFVETLGGDLRGVQERQWNSERFIFFQTVILQQA